MTHAGQVTSGTPCDCGRLSCLATLCYFIKCPGVYTWQELLQWKRTTISRVNSSGPWRCGISGTAASALSWKAWWTSACAAQIMCTVGRTKKDGDVVTAHCTCMVGWVCLSVEVLLPKILSPQPDNSVKQQGEHFTQPSQRWCVQLLVQGRERENDSLWQPTMPLWVVSFLSLSATPKGKCFYPEYC